MKAIDVHVHAFPDELAHRVIPRLARQGGIQAYADGTLGGLKASMEKAGIERAVLNPVATSPEQVQNINNWIMGIEDEAFVPLGGMHPGYGEVTDELKRIHEAGFKGIKMHPQYQSFELDEPRLYKIYDALAELDMILSLHMGGDIVMPPPYTGTPEKLAKVLDDFPELQVVATHMGGYKHWDAVEKHLMGRQVYLETSFGLGVMPDKRFAAMVRGHGVDKVLFGSDSPWRPQDKDLNRLASCGLSENEVDQIRYENAVKLLKLS